MPTPPIEIPFEGKADKFIAEAKKVQGEMDQLTAKLKAAGVSQSAYNKVVAEHTQVTKANTISITDMRSAYQMGLDVIRAGQKVWEETGQKAANYAIEVGQAARTLGTTTEEASRLIQVADDVGISFDALKTSMKLAQKDGFQPNIEGLAKMSDEYLRLAPGVERTQYLLDRFGKSGDEMAKIMEKGGDRIREMSAAIEDNLVVTELGFKQAEQYRVATDELNDAWEGFTIQLGQKAIPIMTDALTAMKENTKEGINWKDFLMNSNPVTMAINGVIDLSKAHKENTEALNETTEAGTNANGVFETEEERLKRVADEAKAAEQAIKDMTKANQDELKTLGEMTKITEDYKDKQNDLTAKHEELLAKKKDLIAQGWSEESEKIQDVNKDLAENERAQQENADAFQLATQQRILARAEELLSIDGLTTEEKNGLIERGLAMGVYTQEAAARMREEERAAQGLASSLNAIPKNISTTVTTSYVTNGAPSPYAQNTQYTNSANPNKRGRASGGPIMAGVPYLVGERGPEMVVPGQSGNVVPNNDLSGMFDYKEMGRQVGRYVADALMKAGG